MLDEIAQQNASKIFQFLDVNQVIKLCRTDLDNYYTYVTGDITINFSGNLSMEAKKNRNKKVLVC